LCSNEISLSAFERVREISEDCVDFLLNEEQNQLKKSVREFAE